MTSFLPQGLRCSPPPDVLQVGSPSEHGPTPDSSPAMTSRLQNIRSLSGLPLPHLRQRDQEIAFISPRAHPTLRALDRPKVPRTKQQEFVCLARFPAHTHADPTALHGPHSAYAAIRHQSEAALRQETGLIERWGMSAHREDKTSEHISMPLPT